MEVAMEDDIFFADLNRRISLLVMDDEEDHPVAHYCPYPYPYPSVSTLGAVCPPAVFHQPHPFHHQAEAPLIQHCSAREMRGTGVFIPRSSQPRRKSKGGGGRNSSASSSSSSSTKSYNSKKHHLVNARVGCANIYSDTPYNYDNMINRF